MNANQTHRKVRTAKHTSSTGKTEALRQAVEEIRKNRKGVTLGKLSTKDLINEGRRW